MEYLALADESLKSSLSTGNSGRRHGELQCAIVAVLNSVLTHNGLSLFSLSFKEKLDLVGEYLYLSSHACDEIFSVFDLIGCDNETYRRGYKVVSFLVARAYAYYRYQSLETELIKHYQLSSEMTKVMQKYPRELLSILMVSNDNIHLFNLIKELDEVFNEDVCEPYNIPFSKYSIVLEDNATALELLQVLLQESKEANKSFLVKTSKGVYTVIAIESSEQGKGKLLARKFPSEDLELEYVEGKSFIHLCRKSNLVGYMDGHVISFGLNKYYFGGM